MPTMMMMMTKITVMMMIMMMVHASGSGQHVVAAPIHAATAGKCSGCQPPSQGGHNFCISILLYFCISVFPYFCIFVVFNFCICHAGNAPGANHQAGGTNFVFLYFFTRSGGTGCVLPNIHQNFSISICLYFCMCVYA